MENGTNTERTVLEALRDSVREISEEIREEEARLRELEARREDMEEQIARLTDCPLRAEWHRLTAISMRKRTPEARQASHAAFLRYMADLHVSNGTEPGASIDPELAAEIRDAMDAMRAEARQ